MGRLLCNRSRMAPRIKYFKLVSASPTSMRSPLVTVEVVITPGIPRHHVVGLPHGAVKESLVRIRAALQQAGFSFPRGALTINLAPADTRKDGSAFDLPIALGILAADAQINASRLQASKWLVMGELSLEGFIRPVPGVMPALLQASRAAVDCALIPRENAPEAEAFSDVSVSCVERLAEAVAVVQGADSIQTCRSAGGESKAQHTQPPPDFSTVVGQDDVKRALTIAAAGRHNVLLSGPPGCGKTLMARCLQGVLPPWSHSMALEATCLHSLRRPGIRLLAERPFRSPHHSVSTAGMLGGGNPLRPGEVSLAHGGVLFLDELPEFSSRVLEGLREPMEEGVVTLSRAREVESYPAAFQLIAAMNPCPCGMANASVSGRAYPRCSCSDRRKRAYRGRISSPLLDRIDLHISAAPVDPLQSLQHETVGSSTIKESVLEAAELLSRNHPSISATAEASLVRASSSLRLSMRALASIRRIARTIAALELSQEVTKAHVSEAIRLGGQGRRVLAD